MVVGEVGDEVTGVEMIGVEGVEVIVEVGVVDGDIEVIEGVVVGVVVSCEVLAGSGWMLLDSDEHVCDALSESDSSCVVENDE